VHQDPARVAALESEQPSTQERIPAARQFANITGAKQGHRIVFIRAPRPSREVADGLKLLDILEGHHRKIDGAGSVSSTAKDPKHRGTERHIQCHGRGAVRRSGLHRDVDEFSAGKLADIDIVSPENSVHPRRNYTGKQIEDSISCGLPELVNENPKFTDLRT
jgi:hypothetical protein